MAEIERGTKLSFSSFRGLYIYIQSERLHNLWKERDKEESKMRQNIGGWKVHMEQRDQSTDRGQEWKTARVDIL